MTPCAREDGLVLIERSVLARMPVAATGAGPPLVVLPGLSPVAGEVSDRLARSLLAPALPLAKRRRLVLLNRWSGDDRAVTMPALAARHADAIAELSDDPVDVLGLSTGGSIAEQLAADAPARVRRLALVCTACRLSPEGHRLQGEVGDLLAEGRVRAAVGTIAGELAPRGLRAVAGLLGRAFARHIVASPAVAADLVATIRAEDGFDLARCPTITAPTLILIGARDRFYGGELPELTRELIPGSTLLVVPKRGHLDLLRDRRARATLSGFLMA